MRCPRCGFESAEGLRFCGSCGVPLTHSAPERRQITVMFCDVVSPTSLAKQLDPEEFRQVLHSYQEIGVETTARFGGYIARYVGDGLLIYFGYPKARGDDAQRAVRAALEIVQNIKGLSTHLQQEKAIELAVRIGIHTGLVVVGEMGGDARREVIAVGKTPHLAARLKGLAKPNAVVISADTHRLVQEQFDCQSLGAHSLKGVSQSVQVYRVLGNKPRPAQVHGLAARGIYASLVGRDAEFAEISSSVERLLDGQGGIISIIGEAGIGKSRLVAEVRRRAPLPSFYWLEGRAMSSGQTISYWPFQEIFRACAGITNEDSNLTAWNKLQYRLVSLFPDQVAEVLPYLASLLSLEVPGEFEERVKYLDGEAMGRQIYLTSRRFFERLAQERPAVLVFEDLHWADQSSVELLEHLMPLVKRVPLLLCGVGRPYRHSPAVHLREIAGQDYADCYTEIILSPLSATESTQLVHNLLDIDDPSPEWCEAILSKAEGNPFFVEEVLRSLIDRGILVQDTSTRYWHITTQTEEIVIPDTIQGVITARVDRLEEDVKQVLRMASVIGRSFLYRILRAITEAGQELDQHLEELQQVELIREKQRLPELEYMFKHALAQEAVYESVLLQRRRELHAQVGACIEALFSDRLEEFYGLLAYHYARAEDWRKAQEYLFKAGDQAGQVAADTEALAHYKRAMTAYARAFGDRWDPVQRASLERKMGQALFRQGDHHQAIEYIHQALGYLGSPFPTSCGRVRLAILRGSIQQMGHCLLPALFRRSAADQVDPVVEEKIGIYEVKAWMDYWRDQECLLLDAILALNEAERRSFLLGVARGAAGMGIICNVIGLHRLAGYYHCRAVSLAKQTQNPVGISVSHLGFGVHELYLGQRYEIVATHIKQSAEAYRQAGDLRQWGSSTSLLHMLSMWRGDFSYSLDLCRELIQVGQDGHDPQVWGWGVHGIGRIGQRIGPLDEAIVHLQDAVKLHDTVTNYIEQADALSELGLCYLRQGNLEEALIVLEQANELVVTYSLKGHLISPCLYALARVYLVAAERTTGSESSGWMKKAKRACQVAGKQGRLFLGALPYMARLQGQYEWLRDNPSAAQKWWQRSLAMAEGLGARYDLGLTYLEMGQRLEERAHLDRAEAILAEVGAELDLARARELLKQSELA